MSRTSLEMIVKSEAESSCKRTVVLWCCRFVCLTERMPLDVTESLDLGCTTTYLRLATRDLGPILAGSEHGEI